MCGERGPIRQPGNGRSAGQLIHAGQRPSASLENADANWLGRKDSNLRSRIQSPLEAISVAGSDTIELTVRNSGSQPFNPTQARPGLPLRRVHGTPTAA